MLTVRAGLLFLGTPSGLIQVNGSGDFDGANTDKRAQVNNFGRIIGLRDGVNINEDGSVVNAGSIIGVSVEGVGTLALVRRRH